MQVSFQTIDTAGQVHGDPDKVTMHITTGALIMLVLGYDIPQQPCDVVGTNVDPADVRDRCAMFEWAAAANLMGNYERAVAQALIAPARLDLDRLAERVRQIRALAEQAIADGHRITWA